MNLSEKLRNYFLKKNISLKNISIESEMSKKKKKKIEDVCVSMDDLHEIESVQHCA